MAQDDKPRYADPVNQATQFARDLDGLIVSVDVSTGDGDLGARVFGRIYTAQADEDRHASVTLLAEAIQDTRSPDPLRELAEWLADMHDPAELEAPRAALTQIRARAREALGRARRLTDAP